MAGIYRLLLVVALVAASGAVPVNDEILPEDNQHFNGDNTLDKAYSKDTPDEQFIEKEVPENAEALSEQFIENQAAGEQTATRNQTATGQTAQEMEGNEAETAEAMSVEEVPDDAEEVIPDDSRTIEGDMQLDEAADFWWLTQHAYTGLHSKTVGAANSNARNIPFWTNNLDDSLGWPGHTLESLGWEQVGNRCEATLCHTWSWTC